MLKKEKTFGGSFLFFSACVQFITPLLFVLGCTALMSARSELVNFLVAGYLVSYVAFFVFTYGYLALTVILNYRHSLISPPSLYVFFGANLFLFGSFFYLCPPWEDGGIGEGFLLMAFLPFYFVLQLAYATTALGEYKLASYQELRSRLPLPVYILGTIVSLAMFAFCLLILFFWLAPALYHLFT